MTPDREAKIAAALAHLCNCYDDHMIAVRNGYSPEEVERRAERYRRAEAEATTLMREPAPDGKVLWSALAQLRAWVCKQPIGNFYGAMRKHLLAEIDRLTSAPVADASDAANDGRQIVLDAIHDVLREAGYAMPLQEQIGAVVQDRDKLRAENARLQTDLTAARAERDAALRDVQLGTSESEVVRLALAQRDAARADQAAMAREQLTAVLGEVVANYETRWDRDIEIRWCPQRWLRTYITTRLAALPQPKPAAEPVPASIAAPQRGDWPEDAVYENGSYQGLCSVCGGWFTGHKRRVVCKTCYDVVLDAPQRQQPAGDRPDMTARVLRGPVSEAAVFDEAEQQTLTAAIPPLPSDEGRVRETVERSKAELAFGHFIEMNPAEGYLNPLYAAVYHLCRRALAGKEKP